MIHACWFIFFTNSESFQVPKKHKCILKVSLVDGGLTELAFKKSNSFCIRIILIVHLGDRI